MTLRISFVTSLFTLLTFLSFAPQAWTNEAKLIAGPEPNRCWAVKDVKPGMKGFGRTVMKGTRIETFQAEVIGVLRNVSPGRDMILCRLSGLKLETSGIIAGMSGSPVYLENKLLGAVAYGWAYGKEPIAGITPFCQMHSFVEDYERRDLAQKKKDKQIGRRFRLPKPVRVGDQSFGSVTVSQSMDEPAKKDEMWLTPLRTPLASTGMTPRSLSLLKGKTKQWGLVPVQGGAAGAEIQEEEKNTPLVPGGPLAVTMIRGDFDLSGIGTVTHIEGDRVYGWGHPFMSLGGCEFPLMTGYIHTIYPRQSVSFKMGSPLRTVGVINADVSTCIAGWLGREPDLLPMQMKVHLTSDSKPQTFNVEIARQPNMLATLVYTALTNSIDMQGRLPDELTAEIKAKIFLEDQDPIVIRDTYSGFSGGRAPSALYGAMASYVSILTRNDLKRVRIERIECETHIRAGRRTAEIEAVELVSREHEPGDTVKAIVRIRPYKGDLQPVVMTLKLPVDMPEGTHRVTISDDRTMVRRLVRENPGLDYPRKVEQLLRSLQLETKGKRNYLGMRVPLGVNGLHLQGKELPNLPGSMVQILSKSRRSHPESIHHSLTSRCQTDWVIVGSKTVSFEVKKHRSTTSALKR